MQAANRSINLAALHHNGQADGAGGNHQDVDVVFGQGGKRLCRNAGGGLHAGANQGNLRDVVVGKDGGAVLGYQGIHRFESLFLLTAGERERDVRLAVAGGVLDDHVHGNVVAGKDAEQLGSHANLVGKATQRDLHLGRVVCDTGNDCLFH